MNKTTSLFLVGLLLVLPGAFAISASPFTKTASFTSFANSSFELFIKNDEQEKISVVLLAEGPLAAHLSFQEQTFSLEPSELRKQTFKIAFPQTVPNKNSTYILIQKQTRPEQELSLQESVRIEIPISVADIYVKQEQEILPVQNITNITQPEQEKKQELQPEAPVQEPEPVVEEKKQEQTPVTPLTGNVITEQDQDAINSTGFEVLQTEAQNATTLRPTQIFFAVLAILLGITILNVTYSRSSRSGIIPSFHIPEIIEKIKMVHETKKLDIEKSAQVKTNAEQVTLLEYTTEKKFLQDVSTQTKDPLLQYIETQMNNGHLLMDIREALIKAGWHPSQVDEAVNTLFSRIKK